MSKISSPSLQMERIELGAWKFAFFSVTDEDVYSFKFLFDILSEQYIFDLCATVWIRGFDLQLSFYLLNRVSLCSRYGFFSDTFTYFVPIGVIEDRITIFNSIYFHQKSVMRLFILVLDWILVNVSLIMRMNLSSQPNFCRAEKKKSQSNLSKVFIQFTWHIDCATNERK